MLKVNEELEELKQRKGQRITLNLSDSLKKKKSRHTMIRESHVFDLLYMSAVTTSH